MNGSGQQGGPERRAGQSEPGEPPGGRRAGGPRKAQEIFDATLELLAAHGYEGLTIEGVAQRSGVNKTTIYRWWPSKGALLGAALLGARRLDFDLPDTGSLQGDLEALLGAIVTLLTAPPSCDIAVATLGAVTHSRELAGHIREFFADRLARELPVFDRAVARGELAADADPTLLVDLLAGAAWFRLTLRQLPLNQDFVSHAVRTVLTGAGTSDPL
ncbi:MULTISPECIES: TetR/AcrR family transcriptional regulator [Streptomyces]|uniref:TetR/AcrR family transcriptional regulator n=1 Tax=Streptomyces siderophoricus TaxID=2802281 RepID=A0ABS1MJC3_9ACTN|nr:TetR/AcrR family transcriptional regulator [Streptomyces sp. 9-7]MBL1087820.1 TetR/AcrR family transcriptional regulator [Streptomyces sp. 9-7]